MLVSLVYEGVDEEFVSSATETLGELGWRATFFTDPPTVLENLGGWRTLAEQRHEIGNSALSGVTLSGELVNWTARMIEQDLHMTQSFLDDTFGDQAVSAFLYPGLVSRCADGDYRNVVESMFEVSVCPKGFVRDEGEPSIELMPMFGWEPEDRWVVVRAPHPRSVAMEEFRYEAKAHGYRIKPLYEAAHDLGRILR